MSELSHLDKQGQPGMVNVGGKNPTLRTATAQAIVHLPGPVQDALDEGDIQTKKGSVFQTAILAGTMAAKKTSDLIPLCHPIGLDGCTIDIRVEEQSRAVITVTCEVNHRTGVEMEALTAASVTALTIYDMCKSLSHDITISDIKLLSKKGGKSDYAG